MAMFSKKKFFQYFFFQSITFLNKFKTQLSNGVGQCDRFGVTNATNFFCGSGPNCNNFESYSCFDLATLQSSTCTSSQWRCITNTSGSGFCAGNYPAYKIEYQCSSVSNCNAISMCASSQIFAKNLQGVFCDYQKTRYCQVNFFC